MIACKLKGSARGVLIEQNMASDPVPGAVVPFSLAMLICDAVHKDPSTGKPTIFGSFAALTAPSFPVRHPSMCVYLLLTDGHGVTPITLRMVDVSKEGPDHDQTLFEATTEMNMEDPIAVRELVI